MLGGRIKRRKTEISIARFKVVVVLDEIQTKVQLDIAGEREKEEEK